MNPNKLSPTSHPITFNIQILNLFGTCQLMSLAPFEAKHEFGDKKRLTLCLTGKHIPCFKPYHFLLHGTCQ